MVPSALGQWREATQFPSVLGLDVRLVGWK